MNNFLDKFGLLIITGIVGIALIVLGNLFGQGAVADLGLVVLGGAFGLPMKAQWSAPVIDPELKS